VKARQVEGLDPAAPLRPNAARIVRRRLEELLSFSERALDPAARDAQHEMRIAAKRLRYVLEVLGICVGPEAEAARQAAKDLQGVLGEIHDCDVMLPRIEGIKTLEDLLRTRRELLFARFRELWAAAGVDVWPALERRLDRSGRLFHGIP
jgi:CHAD domain-containing protein